ncbi:MAG: hypothetical protein AB7J28_01290 [Hyphomonadaceae bacterium]
MGEFTVQEVLPTTQLVQEIGELRLRAWRSRSGVFGDRTEPLVDRFDDNAIHWIARCRNRGAIVAAARLSVAEGPGEIPDREVFEDLPLSDVTWPIAAITRLCCDIRFRKRGIPKIMDVQRVRRARDLSCSTIVCWAFEGASRYRELLDLGFEKVCRARSHPVQELRADFQRLKYAVLRRDLN